MPLHGQPEHIGWNEKLIDPEAITQMGCHGECEKMEYDFTGFYKTDTHPLFTFYCSFVSEKEGVFEYYDVTDSKDARECSSPHDHHNYKGDNQPCPVVQAFRQFIQKPNI